MLGRIAASQVRIDANDSSRPTCRRSFTIVARLTADAGEIIFTGIRIYETKAAQRFLTRKFSS
jgi:hypothetical protein